MESTAAAPAVVLPEAHELVAALLTIRRAEDRLSRHAHELSGDSAVTRGRLLEALYQAADALFGVLNTASNREECPVAEAAVDRWLARDLSDGQYVIPPAPEAPAGWLAAAPEPAEAPAVTVLYAICAGCRHQVATSTLLTRCPECGRGPEYIAYRSTAAAAAAYAKGEEGA